MDPDAVPGILLTSRPLRRPAVSLRRRGRGDPGGVRHRRLSAVAVNRRPSACPGLRMAEAEDDTMFGRNRITLDKALLTKVRRHADRSGYSSAEEFITHVLEKEMAHLEDAATDEEVKKRLQGLGYLD